uniref:Uncharacterized protein n=1 Tax=Cacopsylla melanoneura TaxID=428564 RepID=A0A8D8XU56_9HEMI
MAQNICIEFIQCVSPCQRLPTNVIDIKTPFWALSQKLIPIQKKNLSPTYLYFVTHVPAPKSELDTDFTSLYIIPKKFYTSFPSLCNKGGFQKDSTGNYLLSLLIFIIPTNSIRY